MNKAATLPTKEIIIARTAAPPITHTLKQRVIASTPIFSPYVVFGVAPKKPERIFARPSPSKDVVDQVLSSSLFATILLVTTK